MADNLKQKTISGVVWISIHKFAIIFLDFISGIVLARLLTPHDYGVVGMLVIFLALARTFIDGGFGSALIQKKQPTSEDYSTILYWNLGLSVTLYAILYACAPLVARFYDLDLLCDVLRVQGLVLIINAVRIVQRNQLRKRLEFKKIAYVNVTANAIALVVTIYLAWKNWGVWALVVQQLLVSVITTSLYWITAKWYPSLVFSVKSFKELFSFGGFILLSNLFNTLCNNIQGLLIGKIYKSSTLGYYSKASSTESYASTFISNVLSQISYPVMSEVQNDKTRMISILKRFIGASAYITFPLLLLLMLLAKPIFVLLYSDKWLTSVPYFQILCSEKSHRLGTDHCWFVGIWHLWHAGRWRADFMDHILGQCRVGFQICRLYWDTAIPGFAAHYLGFLCGLPWRILVGTVTSHFGKPHGIDSVVGIHRHIPCYLHRFQDGVVFFN